MLKRLFLLGLICSFLVLPVAALADSIDPADFSATLDVGESVTITKTVTIDDAPPTAALVDVFFLFDTTGSMNPAIAAAKASASDVLAGLFRSAAARASQGARPRFIRLPELFRRYGSRSMMNWALWNGPYPRRLNC